VNLLLTIPFLLRLVCLFLVGAATGALANLGIYRFAWNKRLVSPLSPSPEGTDRTWADRIPILGWWRLRRETKLHGQGFWIRPMLIELGLGFALAWLYWWEVGELALYPESISSRGLGSVLHQQYLAHVVLLVLMVVASFIDIDEKLIPDEVTVTGTLVGILLATLLPWSLLPQVSIGNLPPDMLSQTPQDGALSFYVEFLTLTSPNGWPMELGGFGAAPLKVGPLLIALGCYWLWLFALLPRPWYGRHGIGRALQICFARMLRGIWTLQTLALLVFGTLGILLGWWLGGERWAGLLTALVGLAASGGIVWAVRIIGAVTLRKEAMGFGDVLLMMMIGTFLGWQACLFVFFMAPIAGLVLGISQYLFTGEQTIPYGPFLCLAAGAVVVFWLPIWEWGRAMFAIGWLVPSAVVGCLVGIAVLLLAWRMIQEFVRKEG